MNNDRNITRLYNLLDKNIGSINQTLDYDRITDAIIRLCEVIQVSDTDENTWYIGEHGYCGGLDNLIVGAYWHYSEWHDGQWSKAYEALSALGSIYTPNMAGIPKQNEPEWLSYCYLGDIAEQANNPNYYRR